MRLWVAVTDADWFDFLAERKPDEVNFWHPSERTPIKSLLPGEPFLFKLHSPDDAVAGGGFFIRYTTLPLSLAWETFREKNGVADRSTLIEKINSYRKVKTLDPTIGCSILTEPFFFAREDWIRPPGGWKRNIVTGKSYFTERPDGRELWNQVSTKLEAMDILTPAIDLTPREKEKAEEVYLAKRRIGQGAFRVLVTDAYGRACAATGERTLPVLQAAHIKPYKQSGPNSVSNGVLLRSDLHILFDKGYMTITKDYKIEMSKRIKEEFDNGRRYYAMRGRPLKILPEKIPQRPSSEFIEWHNENVFIP